MKRLIAAILAGGVLGLLGARYVFVGSWLSLVPWSIAALAVGYWSEDSQWALAGGLYGFALLFVFMVAGYTGAASTLSRLPFFAIIGLAGALYGVILGLVGTRLRRHRRSTL